MRHAHEEGGRGAVFQLDLGDDREGGRQHEVEAPGQPGLEGGGVGGLHFVGAFGPGSAGDLHRGEQRWVHGIADGGGEVLLVLVQLGKAALDFDGLVDELDAEVALGAQFGHHGLAGVLRQPVDEAGGAGDAVDHLFGVEPVDGAAPVEEVDEQAGALREQQ